MALPPQLVERFKRHLAEVLDDVAALDAQPPLDSEQRERIRATAHKLAGTAEPYGFSAVGDAARRLEEAVVSDDGALSVRVHAFREALAAAVDPAVR